MAWQALLGSILNAATSKGSDYVGFASPEKNTGGNKLSVPDLYNSSYSSPLLGRPRLSTNLTGEAVASPSQQQQQPRAYDVLASIVQQQNKRQMQPIEAEEYGMGKKGGK